MSVRSILVVAVMLLSVSSIRAEPAAAQPSPQPAPTAQESVPAHPDAPPAKPVEAAAPAPAAPAATPAAAAAPPAPSMSVEHIASNLYDIGVRRYSDAIPRPRQSGGGLTRLNDGYLLVTGEGKIYAFNENTDQTALDVQRLTAQVPLNYEQFRAATVNTAVNLEWFRVTGIALADSNGQRHLYAAHHYWYDDKRCFTLRVSELRADIGSLPREDMMSANAALHAKSPNAKREPRWRTLYETTPCLPIKQRANQFAGQQAGGRLALLDAGTLLLGVGDQEFEGINGEPSYPQDDSASYGKILRIDLSSGKATMFSKGVRNPQGLFVDAGGAIWETEHGPQGGDELNRIRDGNNYGWPVVTFGVNYGTHEWPLNPTQGAHNDFDEPAFAWVPSVGVSNLLVIEGSGFPRWRGDVLVSSLEGHALWRLRMRGEHPVLTERMNVGIRIRDLIEGHRGELVLWCDSNVGLLFLEPQTAAQAGKPPSAEQLWAQCTGCHRVGNGTEHGIGPDLHGMFARDVAGADAFGYSNALKTLGGKWDDARLSAFLADPAKFASGTSMIFPGISDEAARNALIAFLKSRP